MKPTQINTSSGNCHLDSTVCRSVESLDC